MRIFIGFLSSAGIAAISCAQIPTATYTWQVSPDNGATWSAVCVGTAGSTIKVRLLAAWSGLPPAIGSGYAGGQFDATLMGASATDVVTNINRPSPFQFAPQTFVASAISGGIKIDSSTDLLEPGLGLGWVNPGQSQQFQPPNYNSDNPAVIFTYDLLYGSDNRITIGSVLNPRAGRAMAVYANSTGTQVRWSSSSVTNISAFIAPTPASTILLLLGVGILHRRGSRAVSIHV